MLTAVELIGSSKERGTEGSAAWCSTNRTSCRAFWQVSRDRMSPCTNSIAPLTGLRLSSRPVARLSSTRTCSPRATSAWTRLEPINPAPPVTRYKGRAFLPILPASGATFKGVHRDPGAARGRVAAAHDRDGERVRPWKQAAQRVQPGLGGPGRRVGVDFGPERAVDVDLGDARPLVAVADPAHRRPGEGERRARAGIHAEHGAATAVQQRVYVREPSPDIRDGRIILLKAGDDVERVDPHPRSGRRDVVSSGDLDRQRVVAGPEPARGEEHSLQLRGSGIGVDG